MKSMRLASCKDDAAYIDITWDDSVAWDRWRITSYTIENRLPYAVGFVLQVDGQTPISGRIRANYSPPVTTNVPPGFKVHPDSIYCSFSC